MPIWADEIDDVAKLNDTDKDLEAFYTACALHIGDPDAEGRDERWRENKTAPLSVGTEANARFNEFYLQYFNKKPGAFSYITYMIWYERELRRASTTVQKPCL